jgi:hypothetical protein
MTTALEGGEWSAAGSGRNFPPVKNRYPLYRRLGEPQGRSGQVRKISPPSGIRSPDRPARNQSLYRLSYRAHTSTEYLQKFRQDSQPFFNSATAPSGGQGIFVIAASRPHSDTPQSVWLLWTSDRPVAETPIWQHTKLTRDRHPCSPAGFEPTIPTSERPQTDVLDGADTGTGNQPYSDNDNICWSVCYVRLFFNKGT